MPPPNLDRPEAPPRVREKLQEGEVFFNTLNAKVDGMDKRLDSLGADVRDLSRRMTDHERANADRAIVHAEAERALREEIGELRSETNRKLDSLDARSDRMERMVQVLVDRQPTPETPPPQGPITAALDLPPRQARPASTAAVAGGGLGVAGVLTLIGQLASLPVAAQWALGVVAVMVALTACWVGGVRMTRRD